DSEVASPAVATVATIGLAAPAGSTAPLLSVMSAAAAAGATDDPSAEAESFVSIVAHLPPCRTHWGPAYESVVNEPSGFAHVSEDSSRLSSISTRLPCMRAAFAADTASGMDATGVCEVADGEDGAAATDGCSPRAVTSNDATSAPVAATVTAGRTRDVRRRTNTQTPRTPKASSDRSAGRDVIRGNRDGGAFRKI